MKKFYLILSAITLAASGILICKFNYRLIELLYHILIMGIAYLGIFWVNIQMSLIKQGRIRNIIANSFNYLCFAFIVIFYILVIGSNYMWGKTITLKIVLNYLSGLNNLVSVLPIKSWIFYTVILIIFLLITFLFIYIKPSADKIHNRYSPFFRSRKNIIKSIAFTLLFCVLIFAFQEPLSHLKRKIHFTNEPALHFILGAMWNLYDVPMAFDIDRIQLGLKDKACTDSISNKSLNEPPTVIVILFDAMRFDHMSSYGYERKTTPFIDSLISTGEAFTVKNAFSTSNMTSGGVAGLFYSRDWENFGYNGLSLLKFMQKKGYKTHAFLTGFHRDWYDLSAMYRNNCDYYYESALDYTKGYDDDMPTLKKISATKFPNKSFIYIHLLSTHTVGKKDNKFRIFKPDKINIGISAKTALTNNHDNGIYQADNSVRAIFQKLNSEQILNNSIVFMVADHGELLGESGRWGHGGDIHPSVLQIPMIVFDKKNKFYMNKESATIKDIAPTIANRLGITAPSCWEGNSLSTPAKYFSMKVNSGINCKIPKGILRKDSTGYLLSLMNGEGEIKENYFSNSDTIIWRKK